MYGTREKRIAFVQACWHRDIVERGRMSFLGEIRKRGVPLHDDRFVTHPRFFVHLTRTRAAVAALRVQLIAHHSALRMGARFAPCRPGWFNR